MTIFITIYKKIGRISSYAGFLVQLSYFLQIVYFFAILLGVFYFRPGALADVAANVNHVDAVGHVDLAFVHVVQHLLGAFRPYLVVSGMPEETDADDDVAFEGEALLRFEELILETRAAAEGYYGVFADHITSLQCFLRIMPELSFLSRRTRLCSNAKAEDQ